MSSANPASNSQVSASRIPPNQISADQVKRLRQQTGAGIMDCKQALMASKNDFDQAVEQLRKKDLSRAAKKAGRKAAEGAVASYIHQGGRIGVLLEINSETDFAARSQEFQNFIRDLSRHIAAMNPLFIKEEDIPPAALDREKKLFEEQAAERAKKKEIIPSIAQGLYKKWLADVCLMDQEFVKEGQEKKQTVSQALNELISKIGENIVVRRFSRFCLGEASSEKKP